MKYLHRALDINITYIGQLIRKGINSQLGDDKARKKRCGYI